MALCLKESNIELAKLVGNSVVTILRLKGFTVWPDILVLIKSLLENAEKPEIIENAVLCLEKICEDVNVIYQVKSEDFETLIPYLVNIAKNKNLQDQARGSSIHILSFAYAAMGSSKFEKFLTQVVEMMLNCIQETIMNTGKNNRVVEKNICGLAILLLKDKKEGIISIYKQLFAFNIKALMSTDYDLAFAACDFWQVYLRTEWTYEYEPQRWEILENTLPDIIPALLSVMKYSTADLSGIIKDTELDIKYIEAEDVLKPEENEEMGDEDKNIEGIFLNFIRE